MTDPLMPHLLDIAAEPASDGLILAGGFGLRLRQQHLRETGARTLMDEVPKTRATQDLDLFLRLDLFVHSDRGLAVRQMLDRLGYTEHAPKWQFGKDVDPGNPDRKVMVDLLARTPEGEPVRVRSPRVGWKSGTRLHGRNTPEAFAIERNVLVLNVEGTGSDGRHLAGRIAVAHPYAWVNMKIQAAHDWLAAT